MLHKDKNSPYSNDIEVGKILSYWNKNLLIEPNTIDILYVVSTGSADKIH